jgi:hypothetical protein
MKRFWEVLAVIMVVAVGLFLFFPGKKYKYNLFPASPPAQNETASENASNPPAISRQERVPSSNGVPDLITASNEIASRAASPNPAAETNEAANLPPLTVLDKARVVMHDYHSAFGQNPVGTNPEITAALMGKNPRQINFVADSGLRVNEKGEMVDAYGTPFFFHQISGQEMEIRSAGEDRILWTFDDLVTK